MPIELNGRRFGRLVAIRFSVRSETRKRFWLCDCDCGERVEVRADQLTCGVTKSCGCLQREAAQKLARQRTSQDTLNLRKARARREAKGLPSNLGVRDLTGRRFGELKVIKFVRIQDQQSLWRCLCSCGKTTTVTAARLNFGWTKSCGCLQSAGNNLKHGFAKPPIPEYTAWSSMKTRCLNPNNKRWDDYGGRGITICLRWLDSFENFLADMGPRPSPQHSLDRRNTNGNYNKRNCRWATLEQQNSNRRNF